MADQETIKKSIHSIIVAIGEDPDREGLLDTPRRVAEMYQEFFAGIDQDPSEVLSTSFQEDHHEIVVLKDIPFFSICEHHFLPFYGSAHIGYIPNGLVLGASKLIRALDILSHRPQMQERLTNQLVDVVYSTIQPKGIATVLTAEHLCISLRGVKKQGSKIVTSASRGTFRSHAATRQEFLSMIQES